VKYCVALIALLAVPAFAQENQEPRKIGPDVTPPVIVEKTQPAYTEQAREARLEGSVLLSVVISSEGRTKDIKVIRGLGLGLDEKAVEALGTWKFQPARLRKDNTPVPVTANVEINFRLI
jgi:periplasmic protein TonB